MILELATADDPIADFSSASSSDQEDPEEAARNEALGLGGAKLKSVLSEINKADIVGLSDGSGIAVKGGEVLTIIYERMQNMSGDPTASMIYGKLLKQGSRPYLQMLRDWVSNGRLVDPYEELLVKESKFIDRGILDMDYVDEYWERRYTVRRYPLSLSSFLTLCIASGRFNISRIFKKTSSGHSTPAFGRRPLAWRCMCSSSFGKLETQDFTRWKIPERYPRMWY